MAKIGDNSNLNPHAILADLAKLTEAIKDSKGDVIENLISYAECIANLDNAEASEAAAEYRAKDARIKLPRAPELFALRWVARGGVSVLLQNAENINEIKDLWRQPKHSECLTAAGIYSAVRRKVQGDLIKMVKAEDKDIDAKIDEASRWFEREVVEGWIDDYHLKRSNAYKHAKDLNVALKEAVKEGDQEVLDLVEKSLKKQLKAIHEARAASAKAKADAEKAKEPVDLMATREVDTATDPFAEDNNAA